MKTIAGLLLTTLLTMSTGCARSDWIDRTLVTVDVTGTWHGNSGGTSGGSKELVFELEQKGSKVTGFMQFPTGTSGIGYTGVKPGPIDGTVAGDLFTFRQTNGDVKGDLTVSGDEMNGSVSLMGTRPLSLRRVDPSSRPGSPTR
jgi:hypothetical protein